jgi:hypothetical protein
MKSARITCKFIEKWQKEYDSIENDEPEYEDIVRSVSKEMQDSGSMRKETFIRLLRWKTPRLLGIVKLSQYQKIKPKLARAYAAPDQEKLPVLTGIYGIGVVTSATILHFMFPDKYPIMDVRTLDVLKTAGLIESTTDSKRNYGRFRAAILEIQRKCPGKTLRDIDRALFAYHKIGLGRPTTRAVWSNQERMAGNLTNHEMFQIAFSDYKGEELRTVDIRTIITTRFPDFNQGSIRPNDHARGNLGACWCAGTENRVFNRVKRGLYKVRWEIQLKKMKNNREQRDIKKKLLSLHKKMLLDYFQDREEFLQEKIGRTYDPMFLTDNLDRYIAFLRKTADAETLGNLISNEWLPNFKRFSKEYNCLPEFENVNNSIKWLEFADQEKVFHAFRNIKFVRDIVFG